MNEDEESDIQMAWIYGFNDDGIYAFHSHGLPGQGLWPTCSQQKQMIKQGPDERKSIMVRL